MSTDWKSRIHDELVTEAKKESFKKDYEEIKSINPWFHRYTAPEFLLAILHSKKNVSYLEKDTALHLLIRIVQSRSRLKPCALILLLTALWPALDHLYYQLLHASNLVPDLFAEIYWSFLSEVEAFNPNKTSKIAINLQLNVKKRVCRGIDLERQYQISKADLTEAEGRCPHVALTPSIEGISEADKKSLEQKLSQLKEEGLITQKDKRLLSDHLVHGLSLASVARQIGIEPGAARVRFHRAKEKMRDRLNLNVTVGP